MPTVAICGNGTEIVEYGVQLVREVEGLTDGGSGGVKILGSSTGPEI